MSVGDPTSNVCMTGTLPTKSKQPVFCFLFDLCMCVLMGIHMPCVWRSEGNLLLCSRQGIICSYRLYDGWPESIQGFFYFCLLSLVEASESHICYPARLCISSGALNLGPHACVTSALPIELSLFCFCFWDKVSSHSPSLKNMIPILASTPIPVLRLQTCVTTSRSSEFSLSTGSIKY